MITIDFETRSAAKLPLVGSWVYATHPTTQPICLAYTLGEVDEPRVWVPSQPPPADLIKAIKNGELVEAHNAMFERLIWKHIMVARYNWPDIPADQWRCSAARAAYHALPRKLATVATALGLTEQKDMAGNTIMMKVSRPRLARKAEKQAFLKRGFAQKDPHCWIDDKGEEFYLWNEDPQDIETTIEYCKQDVRTERALSQTLPDLPESELAVWQADQAINLRGVPVDRRMALAAIRIAKHAVERATEKAKKINGGAFKTLKQRQKILDWLKTVGLELPNTQAKTIKNALKRNDLHPNARAVLEGVRIASKTSVSKYAKLLHTESNGRVYDVLLYHGASTGRWTGKLLQTQNLVRGKMNDPDTMCSIICTGNIDWVEACYAPTDPMTILSWATRGAICAPEGRDLISADYTGVEACGLLWITEDADNIKIFQRKKGEPDIYMEMAASIYGVQASEITKEKRQVGKTAIIGLGYGMGAEKFVTSIDIDLDFAKHVVNTYRSKFFLVPKMWKSLESAAIAAIKSPGTVHRTHKVAFKVENNFLFCKLPSGRKLAYYDPKLIPGKTPWGGDALKITYMSVITGGDWERHETYGGELTGNIIQATCRDLEANALLTLKPHPKYDTIMHTHDEIVAECNEGTGNIEEFVNLITKLPDWADGFPLRADGWIGKRYRK